MLIPRVTASNSPRSYPDGPYLRIKKSYRDEMTTETCEISLTVNGVKYDETVSHAIRLRIFSVWLHGRNTSGLRAWFVAPAVPRGRSVRSCLTLAVQARKIGRDCRRGPRPKQHLMWAASFLESRPAVRLLHPGILMTLTEFLRDNPNPSETEFVRRCRANLSVHWLSNCRCGHGRRRDTQHVGDLLMSTHLVGQRVELWKILICSVDAGSSSMTYTCQECCTPHSSAARSRTREFSISISPKRQRYRASKLHGQHVIFPQTCITAGCLCRFPTQPFAIRSRKNRWHRKKPVSSASPSPWSLRKAGTLPRTPAS